MHGIRYGSQRDGRSHCNTLQHTATHCNTLHHTTTHCNTLQHNMHGIWYWIHIWKTTWWTLILQHTATHCDTLQHTATHCNTLQHTATQHARNQIRKTTFRTRILQFFAAHTKYWHNMYRITYGQHYFWTLALQHTATHCNTPQHTATRIDTICTGSDTESNVLDAHTAILCNTHATRLDIIRAEPDTGNNVLNAHTINLWRLARDLSLLETVSFANEGLVF